MSGRYAISLLVVNIISLVLLKTELYITNPLQLFFSTFMITNQFFITKVGYTLLLAIYYALLILYCRNKIVNLVLLIPVLHSIQSRSGLLGIIAKLLYLLYSIIAFELHFSLVSKLRTWFSLYLRKDSRQAKRLSEHPPCPTEVINSIANTLEELKFETIPIEVKYNKRLLTYCFRFTNDDNHQSKSSTRLCNLSSYFLRSELIYSARVVPYDYDTSKMLIECIYSDGVITFEEVLDGNFLQDQANFLFLGKNADNTSFVTKLTNIAVFGKSGTGKTNLLKEILISLLRSSQCGEILIVDTANKGEYNKYEPTGEYELNHPEIRLYNVSTLPDLFKRIDFPDNGLKKVVLIDDFQLLPHEANRRILEAMKNDRLHVIISTSHVYDDFIRNNFMNKVVFKLKDNLEKQYLTQKTLSNDCLLEAGDCYYIQGADVFRVQTGLVVD